MVDSVLLNVLQSLMSTNNQVRKQAEAVFSEELLKKNLLPTVQSLVQIFSSKEYDHVLRIFSGVLLRRILDRNAPYANHIGKDATTSLRQLLLEMWTKEDDQFLLRRLCHVIAQSATGGDWLDLLPTLISQAKSLSETGVVAILNLVEIIADYCPDDIHCHIQTLGVFLSTFFTSTNAKIQVACARATGACISALDDENTRNLFKPALQTIIDVLGTTLARGDESDAVSIMEHLVEIAQIQPLFFKGTLDNIVAAMLTVAGASTLEFPTRSMALELMVTLTETAPAIARRCPALIQGLIPLAMSLMLEVEDEDIEWAQQPYTEEPVDENYVVGEEAIERVASGIGGKMIAPLVFSAVEQFSSNPSWRHRRAAVAALGRLAEGCTDVFRNHIDAALNFLSTSLCDTSPMVQYQAIQAIGRFASIFIDMLPIMTDRFIPHLILHLHGASGTSCDQVRGHAASALINLTDPENCQIEYLEKHLTTLLEALRVCLVSAPLSVQEPCLSLLGCVAVVAQDSFAPYYSSFMPGIKSILRLSTAPHLIKLRGKAMECASLVGQAVEEGIFSADAVEIMSILLSSMGQDEDVFEYLLPSCARISKALGRNFEPFLPMVMTPVLLGAMQEVKFSMEDALEDDVEGEVDRDEEAGVESTVISLGGGQRKRVTLNTTAIQQKNKCARILYELAGSLKGSLRSYLDQTLQALLPLVTDKHSSEIRASSSLALEKVFVAYLDAVHLGYKTVQDAQNVLVTILGKLLQCLAGEVNPDSRTCAAEALRDVLSACYEDGVQSVDGIYSSHQCLPDMNACNEIAKELLQRCAECLTRRQEKTAALTSNEGLDDEDRDAAASELEEEDDLLGTLVDGLGYFLKFHKEAFMGFFDQLIAPSFSPYLAPHQPETLQIVAVCLVDDVIEFGGGAASKYIQQSFGTFLRNLGASHPVLRQCSCYGIAQIAQRFPEVFGAQLDAAVRLIVALINSPTAKAEENQGTTENALFALGFLSTNPSFRSMASWGTLSQKELVSLWLQGLPLLADNQESKTTLRLLCDSIEKGDPLIVGENYSNFPEILRIFAEIFISSLNGVDDRVHPQTLERMQIIVRQLFGSLPPTTREELLGRLASEEGRAYIQRLMQ